MVKHIILWKLKGELSSEEKVSVLKNMKEQLESLAGKIPGLTSLSAQNPWLPLMQKSCWTALWRAKRP